MGRTLGEPRRHLREGSRRPAVGGRQSPGRLGLAGGAARGGERVTARRPRPVEADEGATHGGAVALGRSQRLRLRAAEPQ